MGVAGAMAEASTAHPVTGRENAVVLRSEGCLSEVLVSMAFGHLEKIPCTPCVSSTLAFGGDDRVRVAHATIMALDGLGVVKIMRSSNGSPTRKSSFSRKHALCNLLVTLEGDSCESRLLLQKCSFTTAPSDVAPE